MKSLLLSASFFLAMGLAYSGQSGDLTGDGVVDIQDLSALSQYWLSQVPSVRHYPVAVTVAASNASPEDKASADFVCDGVNDQEEIMAAYQVILSRTADVHIGGAVRNLYIGGKIEFTAGWYNIDGVINITGPAPVTLEGVGFQSDWRTSSFYGAGTVLKLNYLGTLLNYTYTSDPPSGWSCGQIRGIWFEGNSAGLSGTYANAPGLTFSAGIRISSKGDVHITDCMFANFEHEWVLYSSAHGIWVDHCDFENSYPIRGIVYLDTWSGLKRDWISSCHFARCAQSTSFPAVYGIYVNHNMVWISSCNFERISTDCSETVPYGIYLNQARDVKITNCTFSYVCEPTTKPVQAAGAVIYVSPNSSGSKIIGNTFENSAGAVGAKVLSINAPDVIISGNTFSACNLTSDVSSEVSSVLELLSNARRIKVADNIVQQCLDNPAGCGIRISGAKQISLTGNIISSLPSDAIWIQSGSEDILLEGNSGFAWGDDGAFVRLERNTRHLSILSNQADGTLSASARSGAFLWAAAGSQGLVENLCLSGNHIYNVDHSFHPNTDWASVRDFTASANKGLNAVFSGPCDSVLPPLPMAAFDTSFGPLSAVLMDGSQPGEICYFEMKEGAAAVNLTVNPSIPQATRIYVFDAIGENLMVLWNGSVWVELQKTCGQMD
ncbi:MAG TPA: right-handed parallel beta-helix repeat-containing protein [Anaerohalosphaeraceae bacterium]|mgnify:FL=1|nr:right-handed parallel beta-helix repeat-containing protein [Anaerohalosphaeraceae bacterium]HOL89382.1 right-handed parallel beta-helix repeat-containing protein [Anaerohalosphaeraceae bacterium]HPP54955.1 right-handed parallel beta-helix repeat-containing protein [Anaerohalosphaeraceae bacterium]